MKRILVAFDGGEPARRALDTAIDLARHDGALLTIASVVPVHPGRTPIDPWDDREVHTRELLEAKRRVTERGLTADYVAPAGDPAVEIERLAASGAFDTVVVGSRRLGAVGRILQGSVSEHVATHADATVVVVR